MPVPAKQNNSNDKQNQNAVNTATAAQAGDDAQVKKQQGTRTGKEQDAIYKEEGQLLDEVKEKYKEADLEAQKQVEQALGSEAKARAEVKILPDVREAGVKSHEEDASDVIKKGSTLEIPVSEDVYENAQGTKFGGKRLINKNIVGVSSLAALAIFIGRIVRMAHKHARKVIFRKSDQEPMEDARNAD